MMGVNLSREQRARKLIGWQWDYALTVFANAQLAGIISNITADKQWFLCREAGVIGRITRDRRSNFAWEIVAHNDNMQPTGIAIACGGGSLRFCVCRMLSEMTGQYLMSVSAKLDETQPKLAGERPSRINAVPA